MPVTVDAAVTTALNSNHFEFALCARTPGGYNITNNPDSLTVGGVTYSPAEILIGASGHKRTLDITASSAEITIGNADQVMYEDYTSSTYVGDEIEVVIAFVNESFQPLNSNAYMPLYRGVLDSFATSENGSSSSLTLKMTSHWQAWRDTKGRKTNSASQNQFYPTDTVFEYSHQEKLPVKWGF